MLFLLYIDYVVQELNDSKWGVVKDEDLSPIHDKQVGFHYFWHNVNSCNPCNYNRIWGKIMGNNKQFNLLSNYKTKPIKNLTKFCISIYNLFLNNI